MTMANIDKYLKQYRSSFGKNYPVVITGGATEEEIIEDILKCLEENKPAEDPKYDDDALY